MHHSRGRTLPWKLESRLRRSRSGELYDCTFPKGPAARLLAAVARVDIVKLPRVDTSIDIPSSPIPFPPRASRKFNLMPPTVSREYIDRQ